MSPDVTLGDRFRMARKNAGLEQQELADMIGVSRPLISMWERNKSEPKVSQVRAVAKATGATFGWLVGTEPLNVHETLSQESLFFANGEPAYDFSRSPAGFALVS